MKIYEVTDPEFAAYGRILEGVDLTGMVEALKKTPCPEDGTIYVPGDPELEKLPEAAEIQSKLYGELPVQIGYCNGRNTTYNGFEYHKGSELNYAVTDFMLVLAHVWQIHDNSIHVNDAEVFFVPKGTLIEMYQTTLHLSPCRVCDEGFRDIVILPKGTNTPLSDVEKAMRDASTDKEARLLLQKNKYP